MGMIVYRALTLTLTGIVAIGTGFAVEAAIQPPAATGSATGEVYSSADAFLWTPARIIGVIVLALALIALAAWIAGTFRAVRNEPFDSLPPRINDDTLPHTTL